MLLFIVLILNERVDKVGIVSAVTTFVSYILRIGGGVLSDRFANNKPFLLLGYGISTFAKPLFAFSGSWASIASLRAIERLGKAVRAAPKDKLISQSAAKGAAGKTFGLHKMLDVPGEMSGLLVLLIILTYFGSSEAVFRNTFRFSLLPGLIALGVLLFAVREVKGKQKKQASIQFFADRQLIWPIGIFACFSSFMFNEAFFVLRAEQLGLALSGILLLLISMKTTQIVLSYRVGQLIDQTSSQRVLNLGYGLGIVALVSLFFPMIGVTLLGFVALGAHVVITLNALRAMISNTAQDKGAAYGLFYLLYALASSVGALGTGFLWEHQGAMAALTFSTVGLVIVLSIHYSYTRSLNGGAR